jgi:hypothetical protein
VVDPVEVTAQKAVVETYTGGSREGDRLDPFHIYYWLDPVGFG